ncbi:MAG TPA: alpha/beta fold hydrolase [Blastocatellia bacterium]|nr:alpha/beta fold hydrolase [Blastocatellia bacterium]
MNISKSSRTTLRRVLFAFIPAVLVLALGAFLLDGYVIHRLAHPPKTKLYATPYDFQIILQKPMWTEEKWKNADNTSAVGWFLIQQKSDKNQQRVTAPVIILSHGYGENRSELLNLSFELWKAGFHVLVYDLRGHGESPVPWSGLGTVEADDVVAAYNFVKGLKDEKGQDLIDGRIGLYGVDLGGLASLAASEKIQAVKAIAVDSPCLDVPNYINYRMKTYIGGGGEWANRLIDSEVTNRVTDLVVRGYLKKESGGSAIEAVRKPTGKRLLFLTAKDGGMLQKTTKELYSKSADQKRLLELDKTRISRLYDEEASQYDKEVVDFFADAIPTETAEKDKKDKDKDKDKGKKTR